MGTRRLLATVVTRTSGTRHILTDQRQSVAALVMRAHQRETICGRKIDGRGGDVAAETFGGRRDCVRCTTTARAREWIDQ